MNVTQKAYTALQESIEHWERLEACRTVRAFEREGWRSDSCPLCIASPVPEDTTDYCDDACPICADTGEQECYDTPYNTASYAIRQYITARRMHGILQRRVKHPAKEIGIELRYLRDLLSRCEVKE